MSIEAAFAAGLVDDNRRYELFSEIDDDLFALLLLKNYAEYRAINAALPDWPSREIQVKSVGDLPPRESVLESLWFYKKVCEWQNEYGTVPIR
jgi:hypothetical protein